MPETRRRRLLRGTVVLPSLAVGVGLACAGPGVLVAQAEEAPVRITSVSADHGPPLGGNEVVIRGTGLDDAQVFGFGRWPGEIVARSAGAVVVTAPSGLAGATVDVQAWTASQGAAPVQAGPADDYTFDGPKRYPLTLTPNHGASAGGTTVTITAPAGADLSDAETAQFGVARARIVARSATSLTVIAPGGRPGEPRSVTVTGLDGHTDGLIGDAFSWDPVPGPPVVTAVEPGAVHRFGGTIFTIKGDFLEGADDLLIDGNSVGRAITPIESVPGGPLWLTYPDEGNTIGDHDTVITGPTGTSVPSPASKFTVLPDGPAPVVDSISPAAFSQTAPTKLVIRGDHLSDVSSLSWSMLTSGRLAAPVKVISDQEIHVTSPLFGQTGNARLRIATFSGGASAWSAMQVEVGSPAPISITPTQGSIYGGNRVVIRGDEDVVRAIDSVKFGSKRVDVVWATRTSLTVIAPPHATGSEQITLVPGNDPSARLNPATDRYTWVDTPAQVRQRYTVDGAATLTTIARGPLPVKGTLDVTFDRLSGGVTGSLQLEPVNARLIALGALPVAGKIALVSAAPVTGTVRTGQTQLAVKLRVKVVEAKLFGAIPLGLGNACQSRLVSNVSLPLDSAFDPAAGGTTGVRTFPVSDLNGCAEIANSFSAATTGTATIRLVLKPMA